MCAAWIARSERSSRASAAFLDTRKANRFHSLNYKPGDGSSVKGRKLYVQNAGLITVRWHRALSDGKLKNIILLRKTSGWYVCLQVEAVSRFASGTLAGPLPQPEPEPHTGPAVGIDVGITHALALSDDTTFDSPKYLQQSLKNLRRRQRRVARRKKGSAGRREAIRRLAKQQEHVANQRRDWWHKVTRQLVDTYSTIVMEDLNLNFMLQNGNLSHSAHDVSLGIFRELLDYKAIEAGVEVIMVNPAYTSQVCSGCGWIVPKQLSVRSHACPDCGLTLDRDVNAALNILSVGTRPPDANVSQWAGRSPGSSPL